MEAGLGGAVVGGCSWVEKRKARVLYIVVLGLHSRTVTELPEMAGASAPVPRVNLNVGCATKHEDLLNLMQRARSTFGGGHQQFTNSFQ